MPVRLTAWHLSPCCAVVLRDTARRWERNRTLSTLNAMDDRLLQDIGINRKDIPQHIRDMESFSRR